MAKRFGEHVVTVVVESRGLESHENRWSMSGAAKLARIENEALDSCAYTHYFRFELKLLIPI